MRFLSQVYTIGRGSVGGITYFANQFHQLLARARTSPVQPNTPYQTGIRSAFDGADALWLGLTPAEREAWEDYAPTVQYQGPLGPYTVPGRQLFIGTLALSTYANAIFPDVFEVSTDPPVVAGRFNPGDVQASGYTGATQGIAISLDNPSADLAIVVTDVSLAFNVTRNRYKGPWLSSAKHLETIPLGPHSFNIDRPVGTVGKAIFTRTRCFTAAPHPTAGTPHRLSADFFLRHICEVTPPP